MQVSARYALGRACAVAIRPVCLLIANNYLHQTAAYGLAVVFLATSLALVSVAAAPHRRFYVQQFASEIGANGVSFYVYVTSLLFLGVIGCLATVGITIAFADSCLLALAAALYFASEKMADEVQRLRLFERALGRWGTNAIARAMTQLGAFLMALVLLGQETEGWLVAALLALGNALVFLPQLPAGMFRRLLRRGPRPIWWLSRRSIGMLGKDRILWVLALLNSGIAYIDRAAVLIVAPSMLPMFMLVVMCFSIVPVVVDFFYISQHRRDFLNQEVSTAKAYSSRDFAASLATGLVTSLLVCVAMLHIASSGREFPLAYVALIAALQTSVALVSVPYQVLYWTQNLRAMLLIDLTCWGLLLLLAAAVLGTNMPLIAMLMAAVACVALRWLLHTSASMKLAARR